MFIRIEPLENIREEATLFGLGLNNVQDFDKLSQGRILQVNKL